MVNLLYTRKAFILCPKMASFDNLSNFIDEEKVVWWIFSQEKFSGSMQAISCV